MKIRHLPALLVLALFVCPGCARRATVSTSFLRSLTADAYPGAAAVVVFDSTRIEVDDAGRQVRDNHYMVKILGSRNLQRFRTVSLAYYPAYESLTVVRARVISPAGIILPVAASQITDLALPATATAPVPGVRVRQVIFANLEPGSTIEFASREHLVGPPALPYVELGDLFQSSEPILSKTLTIRVPAGLPLRFLGKNGAPAPQIAVAAGRRTLTWQVDNVTAAAIEPAMPSLPDVLPKVLVSSVSSWPDWSRWYAAVAAPRLAVDSTVQARADELTRAAADDRARVAALVRFVRSSISNVDAMLTGKKAGYPPTPAAQTLANGFGTARDKAALLVALLHAAGRPAALALTNPLQTVDVELPVDQFNFALAALPRAAGGYDYYDPTLPAVPDPLTPFEDNMALLVCDSLGHDLARTPTGGPDRSLLKLSFDTALGIDGALAGTIRLAPTGLFDYRLRGALQRLPVDQRRGLLESLVHSISERALLAEYSLTDLADPTEPLVLDLTIDVPGYAGASLERQEFVMPGYQATALLSLAGDLGRAWELPERTWPVDFWTPLRVEVDEQLLLPGGFTLVAPPETYDAGAPGFSYQITSSCTGRTVTRRSVFEVRDPWVPVAAYPALRAIMTGATEVNLKILTAERKRS